MATGALNPSGGRMRRLVFAFLMLFALPTKAFSVASIACGLDSTGHYLCWGAANKQTEAEAQATARDECIRFNPNFPIRDCQIVGTSFSNKCRSIYSSVENATYFTQDALIAEGTRREADESCKRYRTPGRHCRWLLTLCDFVTDNTQPSSPQVNLQEPVTNNNAPAVPTGSPWDNPDFVRNVIIFNWLRTGIPLGVGIIILLLVLANRAAVTNFVIHGNLPHKTEFPADDIQVSFIRKQRVNWYGRVVFGFVVQLGLTENQLLLVRRYWLGRVVAFDIDGDGDGDGDGDK